MLWFKRQLQKKRTHRVFSFMEPRMTGRRRQVSKKRRKIPGSRASLSVCVVEFIQWIFTSNPLGILPSLPVKRIIMNTVILFYKKERRTYNHRHNEWKKSQRRKEINVGVNWEEARVYFMLQTRHLGSYFIFLDCYVWVKMCTCSSEITNYNLRLLLWSKNRKMMLNKIKTGQMTRVYHHSFLPFKRSRGTKNRRKRSSSSKSWLQPLSSFTGNAFSA